METKCYMCSSTKIANTGRNVDTEVALCNEHLTLLGTPNNRPSTLTVSGGAKKGIIKSDRTWGIELESHAPSRLNLQVLLRTMPKKWSYSGDGTINHQFGMEVKTNPMKNFGGEKCLIDTLTEMTGKLGWGVTPSCGTHCHIGVPEYKRSTKEDKLRLRNLVIFYTIFDPVIRCLLPLPRRSSGFCNPLAATFVGFDNKNNELHPFTKKTKDIDEINYRTVDENTLDHRKRGGWGVFSKYYGINFSSMRNRGTIEIRYHEGSLDPVRLIHWIALHTAMIDLCMKGEIGEDDMLQFAKITDINELFESLLMLLKKPLHSSTIKYTRERFEAYKSSNPKDGYISQNRYQHNKATEYERPSSPGEQVPRQIPIGEFFR